MLNVTENKFPRNKKAVYTCVTGNYDNIIQHGYKAPDWDYICFTDNPCLLKQGKVGIWQIRKAKFKNLNKTKNARWHKTHPHILLKEYDESIWIDGSIDVKTDKLFNIINERSKNSSLLVTGHYKRNCIYQECDAVIESLNDTDKNVKRAKKFLIKHGMPKNFGLNETGLMYRKHHDKKVIALMEEWYKYICSYSKRDQLSWTYVLWKNNIDINAITIPNARLDKENYAIIDHPNKKFCKQANSLDLKSLFKKRPKSVVYTCITGDYDNIIIPKYINKKWDYICYTSNKNLLKKKKIGPWQIKKLEYTELDNTKNARWHKIMPHKILKEYHESLWVDSNLEIRSPKIFNIISSRKDEDIIIATHEARDCVYDECSLVVLRKKVTQDEADFVYNFLKEHNMPEHYGLNETGIIYRKHNKDNIIKLMEEWFYYIKTLSKRDQLSLSYVLWKNNIQVKDISMENFRNDLDNYKLYAHGEYRTKVSGFKIFEVTNENVHKVITIMGIRLRIKSKKLIERQKYQNIKKELEETNKNLLKKIKQLSAQNEELTKRIGNFDFQKINDLPIHKHSSIRKIKTELSYIKSWQQNFYKDIPDEFPVLLSETEKAGLIKYQKNSKNYLEFGSGGSTFLALMNSDANVYSVESDIKWLDYLRSYKMINNYENTDRLKFFHINIGETIEAGYPANDSCKDLYPSYSSEVFSKINCSSIDIVLVDGRFRVACTLQSILNCPNIQYVLIHDYTFRPYYHVVEKFLDIVETIDTLVVFKTKENIDYEDLKNTYEQYCYTQE